MVNSGIKVSNLFFKSKAFHCLLACANRPSKLKCSFWFVLVYSCFLWGVFTGILPTLVVTKLFRLAGHEGFVIVNNGQDSESQIGTAQNDISCVIRGLSTFVVALIL